MMVTWQDDSVQLVFSLIMEIFHPPIINVLRNKENEKFSDIMQFTGMTLYVRDDSPFSYVY